VGVDVWIHAFFTSILVRGEWSASRAFCFTPRGKSPPYPLCRRLGELQSQSGQHGELKILDITGSETLTLRSFSPQPVAIPTALCTQNIVVLHF
jgi:hypothetical protein